MTQTRSILLAGRGGAHGLPARRIRRAAVIAVTILGFLAVWTLIDRLQLTPGNVLPSPIEIAIQAFEDRDMLLRAAMQTGQTALTGWGIACGIALVLAMLCVISPISEVALTKIALAIYTLPIIALAPLVDLMAKGFWAEVVMAAILSFFPIFIATVVGLRSTPMLWREVVTAAGGGGWAVLRFVRLGAVPPSFMAGAYAAAPAAVGGVIIAEFMGGTSGLGIALLTSQQQYQIPRTWAVAIVTGLVSLGGPLILKIISGILRIDRSRYSALDQSPPAAAVSGPLQRLFKGTLSAVSSIVLVVAVWWIAVLLLPLSPLVAKGPLEVVRFLITQADQRAALFDALLVTIMHTLIGLVCGLAVAFFCATILALLPGARGWLLPAAGLLRSFPVVALTPLIIVIFGRGLGGITAIGTFVVFFSALVILGEALERVPASGTDLIRGAGGSRWTALRYVMLPTLVPEIFAAARVSVPLAVTGALVIEWLATGDGLGRYMTSQANLFNYTGVWAAIVVSSVLAMGLYALVAAAQKVALRIYSPSAES